MGSDKRPFIPFVAAHSIYDKAVFPCLGKEKWEKHLVIVVFFVILQTEL